MGTMIDEKDSRIWFKSKWPNPPRAARAGEEIVEEAIEEIALTRGNRRRLETKTSDS